MEPTPFELTPKHKGLLTTLSQQTGKPIPVVLEEALEAFQEQERVLHESAPANGQETSVPPVARTTKPFWQKALDASWQIPDEELDRLPPDLAAQVDHYIAGTPKR